MKISKNIIIPITASIILGLYLVFNTTGKMNYKIPEFNSIQSGTISSIEIKSEKGTINLYSDNGIWKLNPDNFISTVQNKKDTFKRLWNDHLVNQINDVPDFEDVWRRLGKHWRKFEASS